MTFEDCKTEVAKKYGLGKTLVTGHLSKYWQEAAELYSESKIKELKSEHAKDLLHAIQKSWLNGYNQCFYSKK